jgi:amino acid transporter
MTMPTPVGRPASGSGVAAPDAPGTAVYKGLKAGSLGLVSSVVVGMASTAPAYSLAASLGIVVATADIKAPAIMLLAFVPMYFIAVAYKELNQAEPDCGTTFTWASRAFGPVVGWMGGWGIIAADIIVMANLAQIAGAYSFTLLSDLGWSSAGDLATSTLWSTVAGVLWIMIMTYICYRGIEISARLQYALLSIEVLVLIVMSVVALVRVYSGHGVNVSVRPSFAWLIPWGSGMSVGSVVAPAVLAAVFIYWGWDTAVATNEEADDPGRTPGRAAVISTVLLLVTYVLVSVSLIAFAGTGTKGIGLANPSNAGNVFAGIGSVLFGSSALGKIGLALLSISVLSSAASSTQTTILPTARTALAMAAYKAIPAKFARIHRRYLTPTWATIGMGIASIAFYLLITAVSPHLLLALIGSIGLQIAFYYGLTGFACVWFYRRTLTSSPRHFLMRGVVPLLGGIFLFVMFIYALVQYAKPTNLVDADGNNITIFGIGAVAVVGVLALLLGLVLLAVQRSVSPSFFRGRTLPKRSADLVLIGTQDEAVFSTLPGSGEQATVIAPDLSNLPAGYVAIDPETGKEYRKT